MASQTSVPPTYHCCSRQLLGVLADDTIKSQHWLWRVTCVVEAVHQKNLGRC